MSRFLGVIIAFLLLSGTLFPQSANAQFAADECLPFDSRCIDEQSECKYWDPLCKKDEAEECPAWDSACRPNSGNSGLNSRTQSTDVDYTEEVTCNLVLKEALGGISGYCGSLGKADLDHCVVEGSGLFDQYTVDFLCSNGRPPMMAKASRNEVRITNRGSGVSFGDPFWIVCDEGMRGFATNKRCYDSEFSDGNDWEIGCEVDGRIGKVYDFEGTLVWYVRT